MSEKKRGRPRKIEISHWDRKYYRPSEARDIQAIQKLKEERLYKGYSAIFTLANDREPNQKDVGTLNKAVADIIDRI
jgi:hypothetical protein